MDTPTPGDATIGVPIDLTTWPDPFELDDAAAGRLLDMVRQPPTLLERIWSALDEALPDVPDEQQASIADTIAKAVREHYRRFVVVDGGWTVEQLDRVIHEGRMWRTGDGEQDGDPPETLRDVLADSMRQIGVDLVAVWS